MRASWICLALLLAGCQSVTFAGTSPAAGGAGGGGGGGGPLSPIAVCPVTFSDDLERAIAEVPDRRDQDALYVRWRLLDKRVNASSGAGESASVAEFRAVVDRLETNGNVTRAHADRLRALAGCYASGD
jgi:hypothetical protein